MADQAQFSQKIRENPIAASPAALDRLLIGMKRLLSVLDQQTIAGIRTLEMKISDAGPNNQRVEPHILGLAGVELMERGRVTAHHHALTANHNWYAPSRFTPEDLAAPLQALATVYLETTNPTFTAALGDPLEIMVFKILRTLKAADRRFTFLGSFDLTARNANGRYPKTDPTVNFNEGHLDGPPDFAIFEPQSSETAIIECKNHREWLYPSSEWIKALISKAIASDTTPILVARRLPYITKAALCEPAGIIAHETYNQLYPETQYGRELATRVKTRLGLGYADVRASENPTDRNLNFFKNIVPSLLPGAAEKFRTHKDQLEAWAKGELSWYQLRSSLAGNYPEPDADLQY